MTKKFGRKYKILVVDANNIALDVSDLKCTFKVEKLGYQAINFADITIYNLSPKTQSDIINYGARVIIEAGYENAEYGKIFDGDLIQPIFDRENVIDYKLTLHCLDGDSPLNMNFVTMSVQANYTSKSNLLAVLKNSHFPFNDYDITDNLDNVEMPRGKVFFGSPKKYFRQIAEANNAQWSYNDRKFILSNITDIPNTEAILVTPENGLIGVPQQTEEGIEFKTLLNPNLKIQYPAVQVKIDNSLIRQQKIKYGQYLSRLDQDGYYYICSVIHTGDTRGDDWYSDVIGFNASGGKYGLLSNSNQNIN